MIRLENTQVTGWEAAIRGMRNPMNSWEKSDTVPCPVKSQITEENKSWRCAGCKNEYGIKEECFVIGENDRKLMLNLAKGGPVHAKYRRMIIVTVDITAPLYWWKEFDTYKVGTVANSCSTMHKIHAKEFTLDDFSHEHLFSNSFEENQHLNWSEKMSEDRGLIVTSDRILEKIIDILNFYREAFLKTGDKCYWWQMIQLLPSSYNQKRTVMMNYEVLTHIYPDRKNHKLDEWHVFCDWIESLPYSEVILGEENEQVTYGDLYKKFIGKNPLITVSDYRPYPQVSKSGLCPVSSDPAIIVWVSKIGKMPLLNPLEIAVRYDPEKDIFLEIEDAKSFHEIVMGDVRDCSESEKTNLNGQEENNK